MTTTTKITLMRQLMLAIATLGLATCLGALSAPSTALALDTPEYTPGENYYIDTPEAFAEQDVDHERADEMSASTQYWITSPFYLHWISPDVVVYEGDEFFIGCEAVGLEDIRYEWRLSRDGGKLFEDTGLIGNEHTLTAQAPNDPLTEPYLYRCIITNGDGTATLTADISVVVLEAPDSGASGGKSISQTGDETIGIAALAGAGVCASLALLLAMMRPRRTESEGDE